MRGQTETSTHYYNNLIVVSNKVVYDRLTSLQYRYLKNTFSVKFDYKKTSYSYPRSFRIPVFIYSDESTIYPGCP